MTHITTQQNPKTISIDHAIYEEKQRLLEMGYTLEDVDKLEKVLEYVSYPIIQEHFKELYKNLTL
jgi:hypothetical protein